MKSASAILTPGPEATAAVLAHGVPQSRVVTSVNVIDVERFRQGAASLRNETDPIDGHRFVAISRLLPRKNISCAIEALSRLPDEATLDVVGDGPELTDLVALTSRLGLEPRVRFLGALTEAEVIEELAVAQTLVMPSLEEVWGLVVNEALAAGLHAVVSSAAGVAASVHDHQGVFICQPEVNSLTHAMSRSMRSWTGWIESPEVLTHNAGRFVEDLVTLLPTDQPQAGH